MIWFIDKNKFYKQILYKEQKKESIPVMMKNNKYVQ